LKEEGQEKEKKTNDQPDDKKTNNYKLKARKTKGKGFTFQFCCSNEDIHFDERRFTFDR